MTDTPVHEPNPADAKPAGELAIAAPVGGWVNRGTSTDGYQQAAQTAAIQVLPGHDHQDPFLRLVMAFLVSYRKHSARGYMTDLRAWADWCALMAVHPFDARRHHVDAWVRWLESEPIARTGRPLAPASIARRLSAVSQFYDYGISVDVLTFSPVANVRRPKVSDDSSTTALGTSELLSLLDVADADSRRSSALVHLLAYNGLRIDEALSANVEDYRYQHGHRVLRIVRKGGKTSTEPLAAPVVRALDAYLADRTTGPLFTSHHRDTTQIGPTDQDHALAVPRDVSGASGRDGRMIYMAAYKLIKRLARQAGIPAAAAITPHSLRHTFVTEALAAGAPLQDVQDAAGHADPRTTRRYDRTRKHHDNHPTFKLVSHFKRRADNGDVGETDDDNGAATSSPGSSRGPT